MSSAAYQRQYYHANVEKRRIYARRYFERHPEKGMPAYRAWIAKLKDVPCVDCGARYPPYVMDFDHVRGTKRQSISSMYTYSREAVEEEIAKCDVVCANCHRERTHKQRVGFTRRKK